MFYAYVVVMIAITTSSSINVKFRRIMAEPFRYPVYFGCCMCLSFPVMYFLPRL